MSVKPPTITDMDWDAAQAIPHFEVPVGWYVNDPMTGYGRSQMSIRSENWRYHIDICAATPLADIDGPYWLGLEVQVGGDDSFQTMPLGRVTGVEPGEVQDVVYLLVGHAIEHERDRGETGDE